ncbi:MAG: hypothetical protein KC483_04640 [Nitrosarchaeum sp.]|nr:hypothetical protein [Nitrosarchaeum sp.]MCA9820164.1 hypothetical protein [Nitrosarchaeum sp.]
MSSSSEKIELMISQKRIKIHVFEPSQRKIWTAVGFGREYWIDPDSKYCSCPGFYFGYINGKKSCYHLDSLTIAKGEHKSEPIIFSDDEYMDFVSGLASDLCCI